MDAHGTQSIRSQSSGKNPFIMFFGFFFKIFFLCGPFSKSLLNLLQYCFCFMLWFFGRNACGILASQPEIEPTPVHWKAKS